VDARARLIFGGTTSDNRKFDKLMDNNGNPVFAGMAAFSASSNGQIVSVEDSTRGIVNLKGNGMEAELVTVEYCPNSPTVGLAITGNTKTIYGNLLPFSAGDVDLGVENGVPLYCRANRDLQVLARVNTDGKVLGSFTVRIKYDSAVLEVTNLNKNTISSSMGTVTMEEMDEVNADPAITLREYLVAATISESQVTGTWDNPAAVFELTFNCKSVSNDEQTLVEGYVYEIGEAVSLDLIGPARQNAPVVMVAGTAPLLIPAGRRHRSLSGSTVGTGSIDAMVAARTLELAHRDRRNGNQNARCMSQNPDLWCSVDANCDGLFSGLDAAMNLQYLVFREAPVGAEWELFKVNMDNCGISYDQPSSAAKLDFDGNGKIEAMDAVYALRVLTGKFYLASIKSESNGIPECSLTIEVRLEGTSIFGDTAERAEDSTQVLLDLSTGTSVAGFGSMLATLSGPAGSYITDDKGSALNYGGLVEAT
jgi:hypothetical protein